MAIYRHIIPAGVRGTPGAGRPDNFGGWLSQPASACTRAHRLGFPTFLIGPCACAWEGSDLAALRSWHEVATGR